ncbi:hypothetical protein BJ912DRAFT_928498 [Pholiota molesta]|nr:hypothetical protein BJ912DRAFT_928498 [Pholiota molesta]
MADPRDPTLAWLNRNEDAERDCNTVLNLSRNNVKALFRRGQAELEWGSFWSAESFRAIFTDFTDVLRIEPANTSAQEELKKVATLIKNEKSKVCCFPTAGKPELMPIYQTETEIPNPSMQASIDSSLNAKRRRVLSNYRCLRRCSRHIGSGCHFCREHKYQIASTCATSDTKPLPAPSPKSDILEPISSRSLKPPLPSPRSRALQPEVHETLKGKEKAKETEKGIPTPASFQQAKQARDTARPSRAGGGIFRSSGQSTIFKSRGGEEDAMAKSTIEEVQETPEVEMKSPSPAHAPEVVSQPATVPSVSELAANIASLTLPKAPTTYFDFNRLPALCQTSLEPALLISILDAFYTLLSAHPADAELKRRVLEYMQNFRGYRASYAGEGGGEGRVGLLGVEPAGPWRAIGY